VSDKQEPWERAIDNPLGGEHYEDEDDQGAVDTPPEVIEQMEREAGEAGEQPPPEWDEPLSYPERTEVHETMEMHVVASEPYDWDDEPAVNPYGEGVIAMMREEPGSLAKLTAEFVGVGLLIAMGAALVCLLVIGLMSLVKIAP